MTCKRIFFFMAVTLVACLGFFGLPIDNRIDLRMPSWLPQDSKNSAVTIQLPDWLVLEEAVASPYRRSVRRTSRRTSRRTAARHSGYYGQQYYHGGAAVATGVAVGATAIAVGSIVASLPPNCTTIVANGVAYQNCSGTYYVPSGNQWVVVNAP
jgi:hypothetical protein